MDNVQFVICSIVVVFLLETLVTVLVNPEQQLQIIQHHTSEGEFTQDRAETFRGRAATFVGFTIIIATFLLSNENPTAPLDNTLPFVWLTLGFLLLSYQLKSLTNLNRFWINMQEKTFEYGFISLLGLILFVSLPYGPGVGVRSLHAGILLVVLFRFYALKALLSGLWNMWERRQDKTRYEYLRKVIKNRYQELSGEGSS